MSNNREIAAAGRKRMKRRWLMMPTLDGYIFREFMIKFSILLLVATILFLLGDVFNDLTDFLDSKDYSWTDYVVYFALKIPGNIRFVLPIGTLLGCMWTMAAFGKSMEVTAMRASGVSLFRCGGPILLVGLITTGVNIWFNETLVPRTTKAAARMLSIAREDYKKNNLEDRRLTFRSLDKRRTWLFQMPDNAEDQFGNLARDGRKYEVSVKFFRPNGTLERDLYAEDVYFRDAGWRFDNVTITDYSLDGMLSRPSTHRRSWLLPSDEAPETPVDILYIIQPVEDLPSWVIWNFLTQTKDISERGKRIFWSVFFYRMAFPWSCFLAVFLGIPLATKNERTGILTSVVWAVVLIVAYIVTAQVCLVIGKQGAMNPVVAGLGPTLLFLLYGINRVINNQA